MNRLFLVLITFISLNAVTYGQASNNSVENWACALNLHQGDTGTLSLIRLNNNVDGVIKINRNNSVLESEVNGSWVGNSIDLKRLLGSNSNESMIGTVVTLGTAKVNIGGRFSDGFQGVWSANCDLIAGGASNNTSLTTNPVTEVQPSTSSRISPNTPNQEDRITFSAVATHPEGVESIDIFLGNQNIHSCEGSSCNFTYGPLSPGNYTWRVDATSTNGVKSSESVNEFVISENVVSNSCTISGTATGFAATQSSFYLVNLYGPNNDNLFREAVSFTDSQYEFTDLPSGRYLLSVDTRVDESVLASPSSITINCQRQSNLTQDFSFR